MPSLFVVIMVCAGSTPRTDCDTTTARAYQAFRAPPGIIVCGVPAVMSIAQSPVGPDGGEYMRVKCSLTN